MVVPEPCDVVAVALSSDTVGALDDSLITHAGSCLRCQRELAHHHRLLRVLGELRSDDVTLPPSLLSDVLVAVERAATRSVVRAALSRRRVRSAIGLTGAAALVALAVVVERLLSPARRRARRGLEAP
jgi:hypothetical protein